MSIQYRSEHDSVGERSVPKDVYYGVQSLRAAENFPITGLAVHPEQINSIAEIKKASAITNLEIGLLDKRVADAIVRACDEIAAGRLHEAFIVDPIQGGAGTSLNMNANEVIANRAIELLGARQKVVAGSLADTDVTGFFRGTAKSCFVVLHYVDGDLAAKDMELLETPVEEDEEEILSSLVREYYGGRTRLPRQILLPCELADQVPLTRMLSEQVGSRVELVTPQRGAKMDLIKLANQNAAEEVERATTREERQNKLLEALGRMLGLPQAPRRMESYDISNTGADDIVASMVVFENGRPLKRDYRHFKLKDLDGPDDYASMEQVLTRRFRRYLDGDEKFNARPDLLLIDGGGNHVRVACRVLETMGLDIPAFGMVKDDRHRTRALVAPDGREIGIQAIPAVFALIGQIQEETHRFAIEFNRQQRKGRVQGSVLDRIPGVGEKRRTQLLKHFKSVRAIRGAPLQELEQVVPKNTAQAVFQYFREIRN